MAFLLNLLLGKPEEDFTPRGVPLGYKTPMSTPTAETPMTPETYIFGPGNVNDLPPGTPESPLSATAAEWEMVHRGAPTYRPRCKVRKALAVAILILGVVVAVVLIAQYLAARKKKAAMLAIAEKVAGRVFRTQK